MSPIRLAGTAGVEPAIDRLEGDCIIHYATCPLVKRGPDNSEGVAQNEVPFGSPLNLYIIDHLGQSVNPLLLVPLLPLLRTQKEVLEVLLQLPQDIQLLLEFLEIVLFFYHSVLEFAPIQMPILFFDSLTESNDFVVLPFM